MLQLKLANFSSVPFCHGDLLPLLADYSRPNDKIAEWLKQGVLVALKRGLYVVGPAWRKEELRLPLLANRLYGPSCVSLDYALSWHGLIPERVHEVTSVCVRRGRTFDNAVGRFSYVSVPRVLYPIGIRQERASAQVSFLIASPEKALCDKVLLTRRLQAVSRVSMQRFLFDDLRLEPEALSDFDASIVEQYVESGHKLRQMRALLHVLESL